MASHAQDRPAVFVPASTRRRRSPSSAACHLRLTAAMITQTVRMSTPAFYTSVLGTLKRAGVEFLIGGAYAFEHYTAIARPTKDLDVFVRPEDARGALASLAAAGYRTRLAFP